MTAFDAVGRAEVGLLGAGLMGAAMVRSLLASDRSVLVWNRTPEKCQPLVDRGAKSASSVLEVLQRSAVVIVVGVPYDSLRSIIRETTIDVWPVLVNLTTGQPADAEAVARECMSRGIPYLDGAIYSYPQGIGEAGTQIFFAGDENAWTAAQETIRILAPASEFLPGSPSLANAVDCVMLAYTAACQAAMLESLALGVRLGLPVTRVADHLARSAQDPATYASYVLQFLAADNFATEESTVSTWRQALSGVHELSRDLGLTSRQLVATLDALSAAVDRGHASDDMAVLFDLEVRATDRGATPPGEAAATGT